MPQSSSKLAACASAHDEKTEQTRKFGLLKGLYVLPDAFFFDPLPEDELRLFEGCGDESRFESAKDGLPKA